MGLLSTIKKAFTTPGSAAKRRSKNNGSVRQTSTTASSNTNTHTREQQKAAAEFAFNRRFGKQTATAVKSRLDPNNNRLPVKITNPTAVQLSAKANIKPPTFREIDGIPSSYYNSTIYSIASARKRHEYERQMYAGETPSIQNERRPGYGQFSNVSDFARDYYEKRKLSYQNVKGVAMATAKRDTARTLEEQQYWDKLVPYSNGLQKDILTNIDAFLGNDDAVSTWINEPESEEERASRARQALEWNEQYVISVPVPDAEQGGRHYKDQISEDAPPPPWAKISPSFLHDWTYYKTYGSGYNLALNQAYDEALIMDTVKKQHPYKNAFGETASGDNSKVNSLFDLTITTAPIAIKEGPINYFKKSTKAALKYFNDYLYQPTAAGRYDVLTGNLFFNLFDLGDYAARGARAVIAGPANLGGRHHSLVGQHDYWVTPDDLGADVPDQVAKEAQEVFLRNGGYEWLVMNNVTDPRDLQTMGLNSRYMNMSSEELEANLKDVFSRFPVLKNIDPNLVYGAINRDYFNEDFSKTGKRVVENVKAAYTKPEADFAFDTGNPLADLVLSVVTDPDLVAGSVSHSVAKSGFNAAVDGALEDGLKVFINNEDDLARLMKNKQFKKALKQFKRNNGMTNILFKDEKMLNDEIYALVNSIQKADDKVLKNLDDVEAFSDILNAHLVGKQVNINGHIISSQNWARKAIDTKTVRAAVRASSAIDAVDSAIVKMSFLAPWGAYHGIKGARKLFLNNEAVARHFYTKKLAEAQLAKVVRDRNTNLVDVTKASDLIRKRNAIANDAEGYKAALAELCDAYDSVSKKIQTEYIPQLRKHEVSYEEIMEAIGADIQAISGNKCTSVSQLAGTFADYNIRYTADIVLAHRRLENTYNVFIRAAENYTELGQQAFLDSVRKINNVDDLKNLLMRFRHNDSVLNLRTEIIDNLPSKFIDSAEIDSIVDDIKNGLLTETPITQEETRKAMKAVTDDATKVFSKDMSVAEFRDLITQANPQLARELDMIEEFGGVYYLDERKAQGVIYRTEKKEELIPIEKESTLVGEVKEGAVPTITVHELRELYHDGRIPYDEFISEATKINPEALTVNEKVAAGILTEDSDEYKFLKEIDEDVQALSGISRRGDHDELRMQAALNEIKGEGPTYEELVAAKEAKEAAERAERLDRSEALYKEYKKGAVPDVSELPEAPEVYKKTIIETVEDSPIAYEVPSAVRKFAEFLDHHAYIESKDSAYKVSHATIEDFLNKTESSLIKSRGMSPNAMIGEEIFKDKRKTPSHKIDWTMEILNTIPEMRRMLEGTAVIDLKDVTRIEQYQVDRLALNELFLSDKRITSLFDKVDEIIDSNIDAILKSQDVDLVEDATFINLCKLQEYKRGYERWRTLKDIELNSLGLDETQLYCVMDGFADNFGCSNLPLLDVVRNPRLFEHNLQLKQEAMFGKGKLGIASLNDTLSSASAGRPNSLIAEPFQKQFRDLDPASQTKIDLDEIINKSDLDPEAYNRKTLLSSILMDPSIIEDCNACEKAPVFMHISTTGLRSDINSVTGISGIVWNKIDTTEALTIDQIVKAVKEAETVNFMRNVDASEAKAIRKDTLRNMFHSPVNRPDDDLISDYVSMFSGKDYDSEEDILEAWCDYINHYSTTTHYADSLNPDIQYDIPRIIVHDNDGFTLPFLNNRIMELARDEAFPQATAYAAPGRDGSLMARLVTASDNTYARLKPLVNDKSFTRDQIDAILEIAQRYASDMSMYAGGNFNINDFDGFLRTWKEVVNDSRANHLYTEAEAEAYFKATGRLRNTDPEKVKHDSLEDFREAIYKNSDLTQSLDEYSHALRDVNDVSYIPQAIVAGTTDSTMNSVNTAIKASGRRTISVKSRTYVSEIMAIFNIEDTFAVTARDLDRMRRISDYVSNYRGKVSEDAVQYLKDYKPQFDELLSNIIELGKTYDLDSNELGFLRRLKLQDDPVDTYLITQKLYDDYLTLWFKSDAAQSFAERNKELNRIKGKIDKQYNKIKRMKRRVQDKNFDELTYLEKQHPEEYAKEIGALKDIEKRLDKFYDAYDVNRINSSIEDLADAMVSHERTMDILKRHADSDVVFDAILKNPDAEIKLLHSQIDNTIDDIIKSYSAFDKVAPIDKSEFKALMNNVANARVEAQLYLNSGNVSNTVSTIYMNKLVAAEKELETYLDGITANVNGYLSRVRDSKQTAFNRKIAEYFFSNKDIEYAERQMAALRQELFDGLIPWFNDYKKRIISLINTSDTGERVGFAKLNSEEFSDVFDILEGAHRNRIFKEAGSISYEKTILKKVGDGNIQYGLDMAAKLKDAEDTIVNNMHQLNIMDTMYRTNGIKIKEDQYAGMYNRKLHSLVRELIDSDIISRPSFETFMSNASTIRKMQIDEYAMDILKTDGVFDPEKIIQELAFNRFNEIAFNANNYDDATISALEKAIADMRASDYPYIKYTPDQLTGDIHITLTNGCEVRTNGGYTDNELRYIYNRVTNKSTPLFESPQHGFVKFTSFDDLKELEGLTELEDIEDFRRAYDLIVECWEDNSRLTRGLSNGTSGRIVSRKEAEEYLASLPTDVASDLLSPRELLFADVNRAPIYDPGFVKKDDYDILGDLLDTMRDQTTRRKEDCIIINEVWGDSKQKMTFNDLRSNENITDEDIISYFSKQSDIVVTALVPAPDTRLGLQVKQLKIESIQDIERIAALDNTSIMPYDMYYELADYMNRSVSDNVYKKLMSKYLLIYKAFALISPGTWIRNFWDASKKAILDGESSDFGTMFSYEVKAIKDLHTYHKILSTDPSLLNGAYWDLIQRTYNTDMTYEDFELLRGVLDSSQMKSADKYFRDKTIAHTGSYTLSGPTEGIRGFDESTIKLAYKKFLSNEAELPLSKEQFIAVYLNGGSSDPIIMQGYEDMLCKLSNNMRNASVSSMFDKTVSALFKPFSASEEIVRYAQTMMLRDYNMSNNQIIRHIHSTQFYTAPSWGTFNKLEMIMPFITYRYNNILYWIRMMDKNPRYFRLLEDIYGSIHDDNMEYLRDNGIAHDMESDACLKTGGIPIGNSGLYFKLNNSFYNAMSDYVGGPNMLIGRGVEGGLNPLLKEFLRGSAYMLGFNSKDYFSEVDLDYTKDDVFTHLLNVVPGGSRVQQVGDSVINGIKAIQDGTLGNVERAPLEDFISLAYDASIIGDYKVYSDGDRNGFEAFQANLAKQDKWYDSNTGQVVDLKYKNTYGANNPDLEFNEVQLYNLIHFGTLWDANKSGWVNPKELTYGGMNQYFDFEHDPNAWDKLQEFMLKYYGKRYDYNQRAFVYPSEFISGQLNDPNLSFDQKKILVKEKFGLDWDYNQNTFVASGNYIVGGLNDASSFNEIKSLRYAMFGEVWKDGHFVKETEPMIVQYNPSEYERKDKAYYTRLLVPRLSIIKDGVTVNDEGLLVTKDGKYILTKDAEYNNRVFDKFRGMFGGGYRRSGRYRQYHNFKSYAYNSLKTPKIRNKNYHAQNYGPKSYLTGYGWNAKDQYYRLEFSYNYQYHNPQPGAKLNYLVSPPIIYPYGGGYGKFSFHSRY